MSTTKSRKGRSKPAKPAQEPAAPPPAQEAMPAPAAAAQAVKAAPVKSAKAKFVVDAAALEAHAMRRYRRDRGRTAPTPEQIEQAGDVVVLRNAAGELARYSVVTGAKMFWLVPKAA